MSKAREVSRLFSSTGSTGTALVNASGGVDSADIIQLIDSDYIDLRVISASTTISDTAPASPAEGDNWFNSGNLLSYIYYNDHDYSCNYNYNYTVCPKSCRRHSTCEPSLHRA